VRNHAGHGGDHGRLRFGFFGFRVALDLLALDIGEQRRKFGGNFIQRYALPASGFPERNQQSQVIRR
jgi:hypothetical protein